MDTEVVAVVWVVCALLGGVIGSNKGRGLQGFVLGALLGVIGLIVIAVMSKTPEKVAEDHMQVQHVLAARGTGATAPAPPGWWPDPRGRHELRYWDGGRWTEHVANKGVQGRDAV